MSEVRLLGWPGMPSAPGLARAEELAGVEVRAETIASNEALEERLAAPGAAYDLICPSDYMVERLTAAGALRRLGPIEIEGRANLADWAADPPWDPGGRHSVALAFGTAGLLVDRDRLGDIRSWESFFGPGEGISVGVLDEVREVAAAALLLDGRSVNDLSAAALAGVGERLARQAPAVASCSSEDFIGPVVAGETALHQAWSGPAALAARGEERLEFVLPEEGGVLWTTSAAIPAGAENVRGALALLEALLDPEVATMTVVESGFATPNEAARERLPDELREDPAMFPPAADLERCHSLADLTSAELDALWARARARWLSPGRPAAASTRGD